MTEQIITTIITATGLIIVQLIISLRSQRASDLKNEYLLKGLEEKFKAYKEETNHYIMKIEEEIKRQNEIATSVTRLQADTKVIFRYIDNMRNDINELKGVKSDKH